MATTAEETTGLLSLPLELLEQIADLAGSTELESHWRYRCSSFNKDMVVNPLVDRQRLQTIGTLRLVNKRLYDAASHVLLPTVRVEISQKSLLRAQKLLRIPQIARGIRSVQVSAAYCHHEVATSLDTFALLKEAKVNDWEDQCFTAHDKRFYGHRMDREKLLALAKSFSKLQRACQEIYEHVNIVNSKLHAEQVIVLKSFEHFQNQHREQQHMLTTGQFATGLASLMAPHPGLRSLCIEDADTSPDLTDLQLAEVMHTTSSKELMFKVMAEPMYWSLSDDEPDINTQITAAALLCDIPVALSRAGVQLEQMKIRCLPPRGSIEFLHPQNCFLRGTPAELRQAVCSLSAFDLTLDGGGSLSMPVVVDNCRFITWYLTLCLSGEYLRHLHLHLHQLLVDRSSSEMSDRYSFDLRNLLAEMTTTYLREVCISSAVVSCGNMVSICQRLGSHTTLCFLSELHLSDGSWKEINEILSAVIGSGLFVTRCNYSMTSE